MTAVAPTLIPETSVVTVGRVEVVLGDHYVELHCTASMVAIFAVAFVVFAVVVAIELIECILHGISVEDIAVLLVVSVGLIFHIDIDASLTLGLFLLIRPHLLYPVGEFVVNGHCHVCTLLN